MITTLLAIILAPQMYGDRDRQIRDEVAQAYATYAKAVLGHDLDGTMNCLTSDVVWIRPNGKQSHRQEIRQELKAWEDSIKPGTKMNFTIEKFRVDSDEKAEAWVVLHYSEPGQTEKKGGPKDMWHDTWVKSHGRWQNSIGVQVPAKSKD